MIAERSRTEYNGQLLDVVVDDLCALKVLGHEVLSEEGKPMLAKELVRTLNDLAVEATEIRDRVEQLLEMRRTPSPPSATIYEDVKALNAHHAREIAHKRFYADDYNRENLVLTVTNCEPVTHNREGENVYKVSGFTRPRQKALRGTLKAQGGPA